MLLVLQKRASLSSDALLGLLAHSVLAIGLVVLAFMTWVRVDLMGFLFGDILAITTVDLALIWGELSYSFSCKNLEGFVCRHG